MHPLDLAQDIAAALAAIVLAPAVAIVLLAVFGG